MEMNLRTLPINTASAARTLLALMCITLLLLAGCGRGGGYASPEQAALDSIPRSTPPDFQLDLQSVRVVHSVPVNNAALMLVTFAGTNEDGQPDTCLHLQEARRAAGGGWNTGSGGGGCKSGLGGDQPALIVIGSRASGGGLFDPGYSSVYGMVNDPAIVTVQVQWEDGETQAAQVVAGAYVVARSGLQVSTRVEGLDAQNEVVYTNE
jgi:hypothetical protein